MKKYQGLFIPEHEHDEESDICCQTVDKEDCDKIFCYECLFNYDDMFDQWLSNNRPTDEEEND